jgi:pimeloyl-ACP methyl ester carboxylesterase
MALRSTNTEPVRYAVSADGTRIAYECSGAGPALVLVPGALCDRKNGAPDPDGLLGEAFTVYRYDRRGRGASGDNPAYSVEREIEDLGAVIAATGGPAFVYGHSSGAVLSLKAAAAGIPISRLAVYEPPFVVDDSRGQPEAELARHVIELVRSGEHHRAVRLFITDALGLPADALASMEPLPAWQRMVALAGTLPYDFAICGPGNRLPVEEMSRARVPTLVLDGDSSPAWMRETTRRLVSVIPGARRVTLEGQSHRAAIEALAPILIGFFSQA